MRSDGDELCDIYRSLDAGAYLAVRGGGASCATAPGAKMRICAATRIFQIKKIFYAPENFYINESNKWIFNLKNTVIFCRGYYFLLGAVIVLTRPGRQKTLLRH